MKTDDLIAMLSTLVIRAVCIVVAGFLIFFTSA